MGESIGVAEVPLPRIEYRNESPSPKPPPFDTGATFPDPLLDHAPPPSDHPSQRHGPRYSSPVSQPPDGSR